MGGSRFACLSNLRAGTTKCNCSRLRRAVLAMAHCPLFGPRSDLCISPCQHQEVSCASMAQWECPNATLMKSGQRPGGSGTASNQKKGEHYGRRHEGLGLETFLFARIVGVLEGGKQVGELDAAIAPFRAAATSPPFPHKAQTGSRLKL